MVKGTASKRPHSLVDVSRSLSDEVGAMRFAAPVGHVYNPVEYARLPHEMYLRRCGVGTKNYLWA